MVRSSTGLAAGGGGQRQVCGAVIGGIQAIGLKYGRVEKWVDKTPAMESSGKLIEEFRERFGTVSCQRLVEDFSNFNSPERKEHCARFVAFVAGWLEPILNGQEKR